MGHFYINSNMSIPISSHAFVKTLSNSGDCLNWHVLTVNTSNYYRVRIAFNQLVFGNSEEYLEIGDGIVHEEGTRLARFKGRKLPDDVISVSNAVWINVKSICPSEALILNMTVQREFHSGIIEM